MIDTARVNEHYTHQSPVERVMEAVNRRFGGNAPTWKDLAPLDQFHVGGADETIRLARIVGIESGHKVLDVGSGLGGPARCISATTGCSITGVDLNPNYVELSRHLSEKTGQTETTQFQEGNALDLPFEDQSFDHAVSIHAAMNIADRGRLYAELHRVLRPGGRAGFYDVTRAGQSSLTYPQPWSSDASSSFVLTSREMESALLEQGFTEVELADVTGDALAWFQKVLSERGAQAGENFNLRLVMGPKFGRMAANLATDVSAGRARLVQAAAVRPRGQSVPMPCKMRA